MENYIAYGSNLNVEQMSRRCPEAIPVGTARIENYELLFRGSKTGSYLTIEPNEGSYVPVVIWKISETDKRMLNRYEGFPVFYGIQKFEVEVTPFDGSEKSMMEAFAYIMDNSNPLGRPSDYYFEVCREGYIRFGFDERLLKKAVNRSASHQNPFLNSAGKTSQKNHSFTERQ